MVFGEKIGYFNEKNKASLSRRHQGMPPYGLKIEDTAFHLLRRKNDIPALPDGDDIPLLRDDILLRRMIYGFAV